jgi:hypothetical protein
MYYLDSKVTVGFVGNNLQEDMLTVPDIIVYRKWWGNFRLIFDEFLVRYPYDRIEFPVFDNPVNSIPELNLQPSPVFLHHFGTLFAINDEWKTDIFIRR